MHTSGTPRPVQPSLVARVGVMDEHTGLRVALVFRPAHGGCIRPEAKPLPLARQEEEGACRDTRVQDNAETSEEQWHLRGTPRVQRGDWSSQQ